MAGADVHWVEQSGSLAAGADSVAGKPDLFYRATDGQRIPAPGIHPVGVSDIRRGGALFFLGAAHLTAGLDDARLATALLGGMVRAGIYTAYMLLSKRVKATFVVRLTESAPELSAPAGAV
jgi:hypothetical protein